MEMVRALPRVGKPPGMKKSACDHEPRLPIKLDSASNGEYWHQVSADRV